MVALRKESVDRNVLNLEIERKVCVALRKESVDRNLYKIVNRLFVVVVALRKESVDRNLYKIVNRLFVVVALRKESVDRNLMLKRLKKPCTTSLSARRAWIEI